MIKQLDCEYVENISDDFDLLLSHCLRRTTKLLIAINKGVEILSINWLIESARQNKLLPTQDYILRDKEMEKKLNFTIPEILEKVQSESKGVFAGKSFFLSKAVVPEYSELKSLIESGGGVIVSYQSKGSINVFNEIKEKELMTASKRLVIDPCKTEKILDSIITRSFKIPE